MTTCWLLVQSILQFTVAFFGTAELRADPVLIDDWVLCSSKYHDYVVTIKTREAGVMIYILYKSISTRECLVLKTRTSIKKKSVYTHYIRMYFCSYFPGSVINEGAELVCPSRHRSMGGEGRGVVRNQIAVLTTQSVEQSSIFGLFLPSLS